MRSSALVLLSCIILASTTGCAAVSDMVAGLDKPTANIASVAIAGLDMQGVDLVFDVELHNPYSVGLPLLALDYAVQHGGATFLSGASRDADTVPANSSRTIPIHARVDYLPMMKLLGDVRPGNVVDYLVHIDLAVDAPAIGRMTLPLQDEGRFPVPNVPKIAVSSVNWDSISWTEAAASMTLDIQNTNDFPFDLSKLLYALKLGGTPVAQSQITNPGSFSPGENRSMDLRFSVKPSDLGLGFFRMLSGSGSGYDLGGSMDLGTAFGNLNVPFETSGNTSFSR